MKLFLLLLSKSEGGDFPPVPPVFDGPEKDKNHVKRRIDLISYQVFIGAKS